MSTETKKPIVFVIDDEPDILELLGDLLNSLGYDCKSFPSCEFASKALDSGERCDAILTDKQFVGNMSGITCAKELEKRGFKIPIIIMTGEGDQDASELPSLVKFVLKKPFGENDLQEAMERVLPLAVD